MAETKPSNSGPWQCPERTAQSGAGQDRLGLVRGSRCPVGIEAVLVPDLRNFPEPGRRHGGSGRLAFLPAPKINFDFRPEEMDHSSGTPDVVPKVGRRHHEVHERGCGLERSGLHLEVHRFARARIAGPDFGVDAE